VIVGTDVEWLRANSVLPYGQNVLTRKYNPFGVDALNQPKLQAMRAVTASLGGEDDDAAVQRAIPRTVRKKRPKEAEP